MDEPRLVEVKSVEIKSSTFNNVKYTLYQEYPSRDYQLRIFDGEDEKVITEPKKVQAYAYAYLRLDMEYMMMWNEMQK